MSEGETGPVDSCPVQTGDTGECCDSEPPRSGTWGDCWCTLADGHEGLCFCQPCTERFGAPGWDSSR